MIRERDYQRFRDLITATAEAYGTQLSPQRVAIYFEDLRDLEIDEVVRAFEYERISSDFFPTVAKLRRAVKGDPKDRAVLAWDRMLAAVRYHGPYASVDFQDPVLHTCIEAMGGWPTVASIEANPETLGYRQHEFLQHYRAYQTRLPGPARAYLPGLFELTNGETCATWDHAHDHADDIVTVSEDGKGTLVKRKALPGRPPAVVEVSEGKESVAAIANRVLPGVVPLRIVEGTETKTAPDEPPLTLERIKATVKEFTERFGTPEQIRREELLLEVARSPSAPELKSDLGQALEQTFNEQSKA